jgi:hypothetical protein
LEAAVKVKLSRGAEMGSGAGTALACRKTDQPKERDMAEQHKPGEKLGSGDK